MHLQFYYLPPSKLQTCSGVEYFFLSDTILLKIKLCISLTDMLTAVRAKFVTLLHDLLALIITYKLYKANISLIFV